MHRVVRASVLALAAVFVARAALAVVAPSTPRGGEVRLPGVTAVRTENPARQRALDGSPAWQAFRARHGEWTATWNEATGTPHRALGRGIALDGFRNDAASVDRGVRRFLEAHPELFGGAPALRAVSVRRHGDTWYASYRQTLDGLDVLFADWEFRVHDTGRLTMFGADAAPTSTAPSRRGLLVAAAARAAARQGIAFDPARDRVDGAEQLFVLPYPTETGIEYRTVYEAQVVTAEPPAHWLTYVDAATGEVLLRIDRVRHAISGTVTGTIHPTGPNDVLQSRNFPDLYVTVGASTVATDAAGLYTANPPGTVTVSAALRGRFCDVNRSDAPDASFSTSTTNPSTVNIAWGSVGVSHVAERDAYYHVNVAHARIKARDPGLTALDYEMPVAVNVASTCNAFWNGTGLVFFAAGGGCVNTATVPDVVYHEYGHGINDKTYQQDGLPNGMINGALHEGMADVCATFIEDDPILGQGFSGIGTIVRNVDNTLRWPEDHTGQVHSNGLIVAGAFWDLRQAVGLAVAEQLSVDARHGHPDDLFDFIAFREMFTEVLVADDDNGNLADGTPHSSAIVAAFNAHGIGTNAYLFVNHAPVPDHTGNTTVAVTAGIGYNGPSITAVDPASPTLYFRANRGVWQSAPMPATGTAGEFRAVVGLPNASVVEYYIAAADLAGGTIVSPAGAPSKSLYRFVHGTQTTLLTATMETDPLWTVGDPSDLATSGVWVRADPVGEFSGPSLFNQLPTQPANDHTHPGALCFITANGDSTQQSPGIADVDGGGTTLFSAPFSALAGGIEHPVVEYWRWYVNNAGNAPNEDFWVVDISNDGGGSWTNVENTNATDAAWQRVVFRIEDYVTPTANMRLRFNASDFGDGSLVEAGVDDFRVLAFVTGAADVGGPASPRALALAVPYPNPSRGAQTLRFTLPEAARATLRIYDVTGRVRATLTDAELTAGDHTATWSGAESGEAVAAGVYFARLMVGDQERVQRVMRLP